MNEVANSSNMSGFLNEPVVGNYTLKRILVIFVVIILIYYAYKIFFKKTVSEIAEEKASETVSGLTVSDSNLTLSKNEINLVSQQLFDAMDAYGTDEDAIISAFNMIATRDDLLAVMKRFGTPAYGSWLFGHEIYDLRAWLKAELSGDTLTFVRNIFLNFDIPF
jgi:hypothetical protein